MFCTAYTAALALEADHVGFLSAQDPDALHVLQHGLSLSEGQLKDVFLMRRAYLQKQALIQCKQQDLQLQLADAQSATARAHMLTVSQAAQQIQENDILLQESFMQYTGLVCDGVRDRTWTSIPSRLTFPNH